MGNPMRTAMWYPIGQYTMMTAMWPDDQCGLRTIQITIAISSD